MRKFHLSDILTITTGRLLSNRMMDGVYDILNYMTSDNLFTHQLPRAAGECREPLLAQHPQLRNLEFPDSDLHVWLDEQVQKFGECLPVAPINDHVHLDPLIEAESMMTKN